jgi:CheY-like chemotaxis protein
MSIDRRILIADDDTDFRSGVAEFLNPLGMEIVHAETGEEALEIVRHRPLELALLDMHMPGYTGLEILVLIQEETLGVPCIFWSGDATHDIERRAREAGAHAVLRKPVEPSVLREEVQRVLAMQDKN